MKRALSKANAFSSLSSPNGMKEPHLEDEYFHENIKNDLTAIEKVLLSQKISPSVFSDAYIQLLGAGGKRKRPIFASIARQLLNTNHTHFSVFAASIEMLHLATLFHDDVIDNASYRRGVETLSSEKGNKISVLAGDYLLSTTFIQLADLQTPSLLNLFLHTARRMAVAEAEQFQLKGVVPERLEELIDIAEGKTAALFETACKGMALLTDASPQETAALESFGLNVGIAFQIIDDILDITSTTKAFGKSIGRDLKEKTCTVPLWLAINRTPPNEREYWLALFKNTSPKDINTEEAKERMLNSIAFDESVELVEQYVEKALVSLNIFDQNPIVSSIKDYVTKSFIDKLS